MKLKKIIVLLLSVILLASCTTEQTSSTTTSLEDRFDVSQISSKSEESQMSSSLAESYAPLKQFDNEGRYGFYSPQGEKIDITEIADRLTWGNFQSGIIEFEKNGKKGLLSDQGNIILPAEYVYIELTYTGLIWANRTNDAFWKTDVYHEEWVGTYLETGLPVSPCEFSFLDYTIATTEGTILYETPYTLKVNHANFLGMGNEVDIRSEVVFNEDETAFRKYNLNDSMVVEQDINGLWGIQTEGELVEAPPYFFPPDSFNWGQYENEGPIPVIEWNQELSYTLEHA